MARPRTFDEDQVLDAAMALFWARGYVQTSLADLIDTTGLKASSLYAAFVDKETLFRRAFERYVRHFHSTLPQGVEGVAAITGWLDALVASVSADPDRRGCLIVNTVMERDAHTPRTLALAQKRLDEIRRYFLRQLRVAAARSEIDQDADLPMLADSLLGTVIALMTLARAGTPASTLERIARAAVTSLPTTHAR